MTWPVLRDCKCCEVWRRRVQLLPCEYKCEAGLCACSITFQHMNGLDLGRVVEESHCGASVGNTKITDLVFADDTAIFAESLEVLVRVLKAIHG